MREMGIRHATVLEQFRYGDWIEDETDIWNFALRLQKISTVISQFFATLFADIYITRK